MATIFTRIVEGEIPSYKIAETDQFLSFLDVRPTVEGHTLCIIKREVDYYFDLTDDELAGLTLFSKRVAQALKQVIDCKRIAVAVLGLEVPHTHVHLIPVRSEQDFHLGRSIEVSPERMEEIAAAVRAALEG
ncbi:HIT family protein [Neolewinella lacunae]|uniref:HIT family protein n=1 Tax=Neolewinella lacunae TaxID=1517758 RepID=A0A923PPV3_9BACT|nr:HIT family protein [Neolewinella lacunae]MBC6995269.1 HIT family protein [Neolewinella lacunae]MDN3635562.1 HIT family protein [Neolewinella lacunae]